MFVRHLLTPLLAAVLAVAAPCRVLRHLALTTSAAVMEP